MFHALERFVLPAAPEAVSGVPGPTIEVRDWINVYVSLARTGTEADFRLVVQGKFSGVGEKHNDTWFDLVEFSTAGSDAGIDAFDGLAVTAPYTHLRVNAFEFGSPAPTVLVAGRDTTS